MNRNIIIKISLFAAIVLGACSEEYLDQYPYGNYTDEQNWKNQAYVQGLVGQCYEYMDRDYNNNNGYYLDGATDDVVITSSTSSMNLLAKGSLVTGSDPFAGYWQEDYQAISLVNLFLKDNRGFKSKFILDRQNDSLVRYRLQGEAFGLRAWFQWDLLRRFGGKGMNGEMLGFPIILEPNFDYANNLGVQMNVARNTYEECVKQIQADCDSAMKYLPIAHRDFLASAAGFSTTYAGGRYWGRLDGITMKALLADMYLTYASPLFNPGNDQTRWEKAAMYAKQVIDFKLTVDGAQSGGFKAANGIDWTNPNFPGIVYTSRVAGGSSATSTSINNTTMERNLFPSGFQGYGVIGPTQDLVDAFPMKNGYPITDPRSGYDPANPYKDRDPRFYSSIYYNGAQIKKDNTGTLWYTFENWENSSDAVAAGKDAAGKNAVSRTNYHIKKFLSKKVNFGETTVTSQPHTKMFYEWSHMVLIYAEAINQLDGPTSNARFGLSSLDAMKYLRTRKTYDNVTLFTADPYLTEVAALGKDSFNEFIRNERRINTCFEGLRFYDLRRWTTNVDDLNKPVHKATVTRNNDGTFTYGKEVVGNRVFRSLYLPIPYQEILKMDKLVQNEGWESWSR